MNEKLKVLDLFSGIGGFSLGLHRTGGFETVAFVERDEYASKVLAKNFPGVPIYDDVRTFDANGLGRIDCVTGGYPCQPFSLAGVRRGEKDDRHLWPEMRRIVAATRPRWVIVENVAGHITMGLDQVLSDLESEGYTSQAVVIPACAVGAPHLRQRIWLLAHSNSQGEPDGAINEQRVSAADTECGPGEQRCEPEMQRRRPADAQQAGLGGRGGSLAHPKGGEPRLQAQRQRGKGSRGGSEDSRRDENEGREDVADADSKRPQGPGWPVNAINTAAHGDRKINRTVNDSGWLPEPSVGGRLDGLPPELDGDLSDEAKARASEVLRRLWDADGAQEVWETLGGFERVQPAEILFAFLCEHEESEDTGRLALECEAASQECLRGLWKHIEAARSSLQPRHNGQFYREFANALRQLSRDTSSLYPALWSTGQWEDGVQRVATGVHNRVDRLRCLGNAVVPQIPEIIGRAILEMECR